MRKSEVISVMSMGLFFLMMIGIAPLGAPTIQAAPIEIKVAHVNPADFWTSMNQAAAMTFKELVEMETGGAVEVKVFPAGQLGAERELAEAVKLGTIQMTMIAGALANFFKESQLLDAPYLFSSAPMAWRVLDGWFGKELADECLKKTGLRILGFGEVGIRNFTNSVRPIKTPADLKGLKIRVQESPVFINLVKSLGASPTPIAWTETYMALQQKVADGEENPVGAIIYAKLYEVQKYLTLDGHTYSTNFVVMNEKFFQGLPKNIQDTIKNAALTATTVMRGIQTINSTQGIQFVKDKGMQVYFPTPQEKAMFRDMAQKPVLDYLEKQVGKVWIDKLLKAVAEAEAALAK